MEDLGSSSGDNRAFLGDLLVLAGGFGAWRRFLRDVFEAVLLQLFKAWDTEG